MPAVLQVHRLTGTTPVATDITTTGTRFSTSDDPNFTSSNPMLVPATGTSRSFWIVTRLFALVAPDGSVNNVKWRTSGINPWYGITMEVARATSYIQATGIEGVTGDLLDQSNYPTLLADPTPDNGFGHGPFSALSINAVLNAPTTGYFGDHVVMQATLSPDAVPGVLDVASIIYTWDET